MSVIQRLLDGITSRLTNHSSSHRRIQVAPADDSSNAILNEQIDNVARKKRVRINPTNLTRYGSCRVATSDTLLLHESPEATKTWNNEQQSIRVPAAADLTVGCDNDTLELLSDCRCRISEMEAELIRLRTFNAKLTTRNTRLNYLLECERASSLKLANEKAVISMEAALEVVTNATIEEATAMSTMKCLTASNVYSPVETSGYRNSSWLARLPDTSIISQLFSTIFRITRSAHNHN